MNVNAGGGSGTRPDGGRGTHLRLRADRAVAGLEAHLEPNLPVLPEHPPRWLTNIQDGHRCGDCSGFYVDPDAAAAAMREHGLAPQAAYPGAATPWWCRCTTCGRDSYPVYSYVRNRSGKVC